MTDRTAAATFVANLREEYPGVMLASFMLVVGLCAASPQAKRPQTSPKDALRLLEEGARDERFRAFMRLSRDPEVSPASISEALNRRRRRAEDRVLASGELDHSISLVPLYVELLQVRVQVKRALGDWIVSKDAVTALAVHERITRLKTLWSSSTAFEISKPIAADISDAQWCTRTLERQPAPGPALAGRTQLPAWALYSSSYAGKVTIRDYRETGREDRAVWALGLLPWGYLGEPPGRVEDCGTEREAEWIEAISHYRQLLGEMPLFWDMSMKELLNDRVRSNAFRTQVAGQSNLPEKDLSALIGGRPQVVGTHPHACFLHDDERLSAEAQLYANLDALASLVSPGEGKIALKVVDGLIVCIWNGDE